MASTFSARSTAECWGTRRLTKAAKRFAKQIWNRHLPLKIYGSDFLTQDIPELTYNSELTKQELTPPPGWDPLSSGERLPPGF